MEDLNKLTKTQLIQKIESDDKGANDTGQDTVFEPARGFINVYEQGGGNGKLILNQHVIDRLSAQIVDGFAGLIVRFDKVGNAYLVKSNKNSIITFDDNAELSNNKMNMDTCYKQLSDVTAFSKGNFENLIKGDHAS